jgi:hypothetical protein
MTRSERFADGSYPEVRTNLQDSGKLNRKRWKKGKPIYKNLVNGWRVNYTYSKDGKKCVGKLVKRW